MTNQEAIREAMRRADPDTPGDLLRKLRAIDPQTAAAFERLLNTPHLGIRDPTAPMIPQSVLGHCNMDQENSKLRSEADRWPQQDRDEMASLFKRARNEKLWFWCRYQDLWFSPDDLEKNKNQGQFVWGAVNWRLRNPQERLNEAQARTAAAKAEEARITREIG